jgi:hypothetical protein
MVSIDVDGKEGIDDVLGAGEGMYETVGTGVGGSEGGSDGIGEVLGTRVGDPPNSNLLWRGKTVARRKSAKN